MHCNAAARRPSGRSSTCRYWLPKNPPKWLLLAPTRGTRLSYGLSRPVGPPAGIAMTLRLDIHRANRPSTELLLRLDRRSERYRLEHSLVDIVRLRVSQVNGCPYCIDLHSTRARKDGEMA